MIGGFIQEQRLKRSMTQEYLASVLGISRPTYRQVELGKRELTVAEARKLAAIFEMAIDDLLACQEPVINVDIEEAREAEPEALQIRVTQRSMDKFKQVLLYILNKVGAKPNVGETVLHKLLYFIDFDYYEKYEENLMGLTYIKNHHGPTSVEFASVIKDMQEKGEIEAVKSTYFKYEQKKYLPLQRADLGAFSAREIEQINNVLARLSDKSAAELEQYSHKDIPWVSAQFGKPLSYESVFYRDERYSVRNYDDPL